MSTLSSLRTPSIITSLLVILVLSFVGFIVFRGFFHLGICCDEITLIVTANDNTANPQALYTLFTGPYGSQYLLMYLMYVLFKFNFSYYYITSIVLRLLAAFSLYFLTFKISKNRIVGFLAALWLMVSYAGLETTEGVNNSTTYLSLVFLNIGFMFLYRYYQTAIKTMYTKTFMLSLVCFFAAFIIGPIRMHGLLFLYLLIEGVFFFAKKSSLKSVVIRIFLFLGMVYVVSQIGFFRAEGTARFITGSPLIGVLHLLVGLQKSVAFMMINFYQIIFPPQVLTFINPFTIVLSQILIDTYSLHIVYILLLEFFITVAFILKNRRRRYSIIYSAIFVIEALFLFLLQNQLAQKVFSANQIMDVVLGMFMLLLSLRATIAILKRNQTQGFILLCLLFSPFAFFLTYYAIDANTYIEVTSRYMFISAEGIYFFYIYLIYLLIMPLKNKVRYPEYFLVSFILVLIPNIYDTKQFIAIREGFRSNNRMQAAFQTMDHEIQKDKGTNTPLVLLTTDSVSENGDFMYWSIVYGGNARFVLQGNKNQSPTFISSLSELKKHLTTDHVDKEDVFSFVIKHKRVYINTNSIRSQLFTQ